MTFDIFKFLLNAVFPFCSEKIETKAIFFSANGIAYILFDLSK